MKFLRKHYHWVIAAVVFVQLLLYGGAVNNFSAYHMIPISQALGITRTNFSLANSLRAVVCAGSALFSGLLIRRFGYRRAVPAGLAFAAGAYALVALSDSYGMLMLSTALSGVPDGLCLVAAATILINSWFRKHRGAVLGAATAATGIGSTLLGYAQTAAIDAGSWRLSMGIMAGAIFLAAMLVLLFVKNHPQELQLRPFGEGTKEKMRKSFAPVGLPLSRLKKQPTFYLLCLCTLLSCISVLLVSYQIVPYLQDVGFSATEAGRMYGIMMFLLGFVKLGMGVLCDRIGTKRVVIICHLACIVSALLLMLLPKTDVAMVAALLVFAVALPMTTIIFPLLSAELLGYLDQGRYIGIVMAMVSTASVISSPIANAIFDAVGSYVLVFRISVGISCVMLLVYGVLFIMSARMLKKYEAEAPEHKVKVNQS